MSEKEIPRQIREQLITASRQMRKSPTKAEAFLWKHLREKQLGGFKFRRQHIIYAYIVDFYCSSAKLVIEIDGAIHKTQAEYDKERELDLKDRGYQVARFTNDDVFEDTEKVLAHIYDLCMEHISSK